MIDALADIADIPPPKPSAKAIRDTAPAATPATAPAPVASPPVAATAPPAVTVPPPAPTTASEPSAAPSPSAAPAASARSDGYQGVDGGAETYDGATLMVQAYSAVWLIVLGWVVLLWRKQAALTARLDGLEAAIDRAATALEQGAPASGSTKAPADDAGEESA